MSLRAPGNNNPGRLDRRVTLQYATDARDALGGVTKTWIEAASVWASKQSVSGGRLYAAEAKLGEDVLVYRIRHRTDVRRFWRLVHGDDTFEITYIAEVGRSQFLDLTIRGLDQSTGDTGSTDTALTVLLLEGSGSDFLELEDGSAIELEDAA